MLIWGYKTEAMFDIWSLEHFVNGIAMAGGAQFVINRVFKKIEITPLVRTIISFILVFAVALFWECAEHYLEAGVLPGLIGERVTYWFQGIEHWSNRLIGDTLTVMLGWYIYGKKKNIALVAKIFTSLWMLVHIFIFPDSMYLQRLLFP